MRNLPSVLAASDTGKVKKFERLVKFKTRSILSNIDALLIICSQNKSLMKFAVISTTSLPSLVLISGAENVKVRGMS